MKVPTFSVIIPMYNAQNTIVATVQSCIDQRVKPLEIIVVDDASTDNSVALLKQTFGDQVNLMAQPHNQGPSAARNRGWAAAQGDWVAFLDSDDQWHPEKLNGCAQALVAEPQTDMLWHHYDLAYPIYREWNISALDIEPTSSFKLLPKNVVSSSAVLFQRNLEIRFDEGMRYCEDYHIALMASDRYRCIELKRVLTKIGRPVLAEGGASAALWKMRQGEIKAYTAWAQRKPKYALLWPVLMLWSGIKHIRALVKH